MPRLSFRFKLLFAMMLVVGGVSGVTLFLTQQRVQDAYEKLFKDKLRTELTNLPDAQEARLRTFREKCSDLAKSVRVQAALRDADENLYTRTQDDLRSILSEDYSEGVKEAAERLAAEAGLPTPPLLPPGKGPRKEPANPLASELARVVEAQRRKGLRPGMTLFRPTTAIFFGFFDAKGSLIAPPSGPKFNLAQFLKQARFRQQMEQIGRVIPNLTEQQVGYLDPDIDPARPRLLELIVTPMIDAATSELIGALVLGFPYADTEQVISEVSDIKNGTWLEGRLYTKTIDDAVRKDVVAQLPSEISQHPDPREDLMITVMGIPHRIYYTPLNPGSMLPLAYKVGLYSWESALRAQEDLRYAILRFSGLALVGALIVSLFLAHGLSVPIRELVGGTEQISKGNFKVQVPVRGRDDMGQLAQSFNEMAAGLALKEKYHSILHTIADKDVAQQLLDGKIALGGELRETTVMFCDIRGFTALTQNMNPTEVIALLKAHMTVLTKIVTAHHGVVDKFIGDSIMALFGAPKSYGNDALNAVRCAQQMMAARARLNETSRYHLEIGIGIASGQVLAGNMGSADRSNYTVLGERVNLAARLCSVAARGEIVLGPATREQLGDFITVEQMDPLQLKGFSDSVVAFKLVEVRTEPQTAAQPV